MSSIQEYTFEEFTRIPFVENIYNNANLNMDETAMLYDLLQKLSQSTDGFVYFNMDSPTYRVLEVKLQKQFYSVDAVLRILLDEIDSSLEDQDD